MKKNLLQFLFALLLWIPLSGPAQILEPVKWRFSSESLGNNEFNLVFVADIDPKWHLYSQDIPMSPPATTFTFQTNSQFELIGNVVESASVEQYDPNFEMVLKFFSKTATFKQKVKLLTDQKVEVKGIIEFMSCDDTRCLPPTEEEFSFVLTGQEVMGAGIQQQNTSQGVLDPVKWEYRIDNYDGQSFELVFNARIDDGFHLYSLQIPENGPLPTEFSFEESGAYTLSGEPFETTEGKVKYDEIFEMDIKSFEKNAAFRQKFTIAQQEAFLIKGEIAYMVCNDVGCVALYHDFEIPYDGNGNINQEPISEVKTQEMSAGGSADITGSNASLWGFFLLAFLGGLAAILTPCVFPMIPMTVSFFMKDKEHKLQGRIQAIVYGISIIAIYTLIGSILAVIAGPDIANWLSTHWIPNILFFLIFVIFAASFFGMFEITMPHWIVNKSDAKADQGGVTGSIFMALTLVLVSFSCTGPIVGTILVESAGGQVLKPIIGMFGFSLAFALPFTLFAFFPSWLSNLPKSGGWLNSVKVVLGFLELALGLKFLSVADQTYHWGILDREVYLALWIVIFFLMGLYLLGKIKFAHDSDVKHLSVPRLMLAIITFSFVVYLIPGMFGAPLKALSGYMPPMHTHDFDLNKMIRDNSSLATGSYMGNKMAQNEECETPKYHDILHLPHGLNGYYDFEQGLSCAKALNKPIFIDFTGHGCVNCREMEANVWSDPRVLRILQEEYLIIALYVDDKTTLPEEDWVTSTYDGKVKKTIGRKYADFQVTKFNVNAQPYYVLMGHNNEVLVQPRAYNLDVDEFVKFLELGVKNFKEGKFAYTLD